MARLIRTLRGTLMFPLSSSKLRIDKFQLQQRNPVIPFLLNPFSQCTQRTYISDMRKSAFEANILRLLRNEIDYELERSPPSQLVTKFNSFVVDSRPGERWIRLTRKFAENEEIRLEVTMFDGAAPAPKSAGVDAEMQLHITLLVNICKGENLLEIMCSAWPDSLEINRLYVHSNKKMPPEPYTGPEFKELDDELQDSLYEFLEARGIDDELSTFLHHYMKNKDKMEIIKWMETVKSVIENK